MDRFLTTTSLTDPLTAGFVDVLGEDIGLPDLLEEVVVTGELKRTLVPVLVLAFDVFGKERLGGGERGGRDGDGLEVT